MSRAPSTRCRNLPRLTGLTAGYAVTARAFHTYLYLSMTVRRSDEPLRAYSGVGGRGCSRLPPGYEEAQTPRRSSLHPCSGSQKGMLRTRVTHRFRGSQDVLVLNLGDDCLGGRQKLASVLFVSDLEISGLFHIRRRPAGNFWKRRGG